MENWRGGRHFFDDGILCLSTLLLFSSVRVPLSPFSTSSCVCSTVLSSYIRVQLFNSNISFNNFNSLVTLTSFSFFLFVRVFFFFFPWMFNEARTVRDRSSSRSVSSSISFSNRWQQYTRRWGTLLYFRRRHIKNHQYHYTSWSSFCTRAGTEQGKSRIQLFAIEPLVVVVARATKKKENNDRIELWELLGILFFHLFFIPFRQSCCLGCWGVPPANAFSWYFAMKKPHSQDNWNVIRISVLTLRL
jgi:hypothetical protein